MADEYEQQCQLRMESALGSVRQTLQLQDGAIAEIRRVQGELDAKLTDIKDSTQPIVRAIESMEAGIHTIGNIGRAGARIGEWAWKLGKFGALVLALWIFIKAIILGQPIAEAWSDLMRVFR